jgi:hypothetical protein
MSRALKVTLVEFFLRPWRTHCITTKKKKKISVADIAL